MATPAVDRPKHPEMRPGRVHFIVFVGFACVVLGLLAYFLNLSHQQTKHAVEVSARNGAKVLATHIDAMLRRVEANGEHVSLHLLATQGATSTVSITGETRETLDALSRRFEEVRELFVLDAEGAIIYASQPQAGPPAYHQPSQFAALKTHATGEPLFTASIQATARGERVLVVYQPVIRPDGTLVGAVGTALDLEHLARMFAAIDVGAQGVVSMRRSDDSRLVVRWPIVEQEINQPASQTPPYQKIQAGEMAGVMRYIGKSDSVDRIFAFHNIADYPMYVLVGFSVAEQFATWQHMATISGALTLGVLAILWLILRRLARSETQLHAHRHHLELLVEEKTAKLLLSERNARLILDSSADGLYGVDRNGCVTFVNPAACQMLGYSQEAMLGRLIHPLIHHSHADGTPYPSENCPCLRALEDGGKVRIDNEVYWHADGHAIPVMYATHPIVEQGVVTGAVVSFIDVSEQRATAEAQRRAMQEAEQLARARSEFLANMSHEIRTPLHGVLGFASIGLRNAGNPEKAANAFEKIHRSGQLLLTVINDVLDYSKIEAGKLNIESVRVNVPELLQESVELVADKAADKGLKVTLDIAPDLPADFHSDPIRLKQIVLNLLSNAVKFTDRGEITLGAHRLDDTVHLRVSDTGIGMDKEQLARIFTAFEQGDGSTTRKFGGTGLGLAITQRIVELMGGRIEAQSTPGVGSTFDVYLPLHPVAAPADTSAPG